MIIPTGVQPGARPISISSAANRFRSSCATRSSFWSTGVTSGERDSRGHRRLVRGPDWWVARRSRWRQCHDIRHDRQDHVTSRAKTDYLQIRISPADKARLRRRAERAGKDVSTYVMDRVLPARGAEFERLVDRARGPEAAYGFAALHDFLAALSRPEFGRAVDGDPLRRSDNARFANYVAAMVEHSAAQSGLRAPAWTADVTPLDAPWFASDLLSLRLHLLLNAPAAFRTRNLFVDAVVGDRI